MNPKKGNWLGVAGGCEALPWITDGQTLFPRRFLSEQQIAELAASSRAGYTVTPARARRQIATMRRRGVHRVADLGQVNVRGLGYNDWTCHVFARQRSRATVTTVQKRKLDFAIQYMGKPTEYRTDPSSKYLIAYRGQTLLFIIASTCHGVENTQDVIRRLDSKRKAAA